MNLGLRFIELIVFLVTAFLTVILAIQLIRYSFKKIPFPKKLTMATAAGLTLLLAIFIYIQYFFTFGLIEKDNMQPGVGPILSLNETYAATVYYEPYGGVLGGVNVWMEVKNEKEDSTKIVYYADAKSEVVVHWEDDTTLAITNVDPNDPNINRNITLKIEHEIYHENGLACQSLLLLSSYETCYQYE